MRKKKERKKEFEKEPETETKSLIFVQYRGGGFFAFSFLGFFIACEFRGTQASTSLPDQTKRGTETERHRNRARQRETVCVCV